MTIPQKAILSFLLAFFLIAGIIGFFYFGFFDCKELVMISQSAGMLVFLIIFLTLFLVIFFLFSIKRNYNGIEQKESAVKQASAAVAPLTPGSPPERALKASSPNHGLLAAATHLAGAASPSSPVVSSAEVIIEQNGIPYINSDALNNKEPKEKINSDFAKLVELVTAKT